MRLAKFAWFPMALISMSFGCESPGPVKQDVSPVSAPRQFVVLLDLSLSRTPGTEKDGIQFLNRLADELQFGDRVVVLQVQEEGLKEQAKHWTDDMPTLTDPTFVSSQDTTLLTAERESFRNAVKVLSSLPPGVKLIHTDLFTTLNLAGEYVHDYANRPTTLIILSDMLQSANGIEMEHAQRMPSSIWLSKQAQLGLIPKFHDACVVVVGADGTTSEGARVRDFWQKYFEATGARLLSVNFRATPPASGYAACR